MRRIMILDGGGGFGILPGVARKLRNQQPERQSFL
jgi:hypothetical protein